MTFQNPVVAGEQLVRSGIKSANYVAGSTGWRIGEDGTAEFQSVTTGGYASGDSASYNNLSAKTSFSYQGTELSALLAMSAPGSTAAFYLSPSAPRSTTAGTETLLLQTTFTYQSGRQYYIHFSHVRVKGSAIGNCWFMVRHRLSANGNVVVTDPSGTRINEKRFWAAGAYDGMGPTFKEIGAILDTGGYQDGANVNTALSIGSDAGVSVTFDNGDDWLLSVLDLGPRALASGVDLYTSPTAPATQNRTFQLTSIASQSYNDAGQAAIGAGANNDSYMYYGLDPSNYNGIWRSHCWFSTSSTAGGNGLGSLANMVGVPAASVSYLDVFIYTDWWYYVAGGTLYVGWTSNGVNHSTENKGSGLYDQIAVNYNGRNQGRWISLKGSAIQTAILSGTFQGIILGPSPYTDLAHYGYAAGQSSPNPPLLRAGYYK